MKYLYHWQQFDVGMKYAISGSMNGYESMELCKAAAPKNDGVKFFRKACMEEVDAIGQPIDSGE